ncbi:hypothetical protein [Clostridium oryzae]|uniref:Uncharacterized protein n=1 Tax=Clostridium oryzae TaxID=1450648 RepID=A0A1V4ITA9_9CLOT|nr:hypothetical protein [Clostridium oryzae]OPJ63258.1 hypothetical protein CLORY_13410 [Clostridium oryzae]
MVISVMLMTAVNSGKLTNAQIEQKARTLGMGYPDEYKVIDGGNSK